MKVGNGGNFIHLLVFCAPNLQAQIKQICQNIVNHFAEIEHKKITRMVLYFKVAHDGVLWLLWSSSIRIASVSFSLYSM